MLLDLRMQRVDGLSALRRLCESGHGVPVILLTATDETVDRILGLEMGADDYVGKPVDLRELKARIKAVIKAPASSARCRVDGIHHDAAVAALPGLERTRPERSRRRRRVLPTPETKRRTGTQGHRRVSRASDVGPATVDEPCGSALPAVLVSREGVGWGFRLGGGNVHGSVLFEVRLRIDRDGFRGCRSECRESVVTVTRSS